jgi:ABC-type ATPase involved in cell division
MGQYSAIMLFPVKRALVKRNGMYRFENIGLAQDEFAVLPVSEPLDLWLGRVSLKNKQIIPIVLECTFDNGESLSIEVTLTYNRFSIHPNYEGNNPQIFTRMGITFVPGFTGFAPKETKVTSLVRQTLISQGQHGQVVRNVLLELKENNTTAYKGLQDILHEVFPMINLDEIEFDETRDLYIRTRYLEQEDTVAFVAHSLDEHLKKTKRKRQKNFDIISAGSGFHQFVQIFANILLESPTTVLLDEPDAHVNGLLQKKLLRLFDRLVREQKIQVVIATHSSELISAAEPSQILSFETGKPEPLQVRADVLYTLDYLGSMDNLALALIRIYRKVIFVEDKTDKILIERFLERIWGRDDYLTLQRKMIYLFLHGHTLKKPIHDIVGAMQGLFETANRIDAFVIADRDYILDEQMAEEHQKIITEQMQGFIWARNEIENYLLVPEVIARVVMSKVASYDIFTEKLTEDIIKQKLEMLADETKDSVVLDRIMDRYQEKERGRLQSSTCRKKALQYIQQRWNNKSKYSFCDAKDHVLPKFRQWLKSEFNLSFADTEIIDAMKDNEIPADVKDLATQLHDFLVT